MKIISTLAVFFTLFLSHSFAQSAKFGKVTKEELKATSHPVEHDADAAVLFQKGLGFIRFNNSTDRMELTYEVYRKIKIYDDNASNLANIRLPFYENDRQVKEGVASINAITYNLEDNTIIKSKVERKDIYVEKIDDNHYVKKFALPNVKAGSVIEIKYKFTSPFIAVLPIYKFQYNIPVNESYFKIEIPEYYEYKIDLKGSFPITKKEEGGSGSFSFSNNSRVRSTFRTMEQGKINYETVRYAVTKYIYSAKDIPSLKNEPYLLSIEDYQQAVIFSLSHTSFPSLNNSYLAKSWSSIATLLNKSTRFGSELNKNYNNYDAFISSIEGLNNLEKLKKIFYKVQTEFTWNKTSNRYTDKGVRELIKNKIGPSTEINLLLVNLLQKAEVPAKALITKPREDGILRLEHPSLIDLVYVIATATVGGKVYYLDATDKFSSVNEIPERATNINGIILNGNAGIESNIQNPNIYQNQIVKTITLNEDQILSISETEKKSGTAASSFRRNTSNFSTNKKLIEKLENEMSGLVIDTISFKNRYINDLPITIQSQYKLENQTELIDDKLFVKIPLDNFITTNPFKSQKRDFAIFYPERKKVSSIITFIAPDGYEIESLPESTRANIEVANFTYLIQKTNDKTVQISTNFNIDETIIAPSYYEYMKKLYDLIIEKNSEAIILKKI